MNTHGNKFLVRIQACKETGIVSCWQRCLYEFQLCSYLNLLYLFVRLILMTTITRVLLLKFVANIEPPYIPEAAVETTQRLIVSSLGLKTPDLSFKKTNVCKQILVSDCSMTPFYAVSALSLF